MWKLQKPVIYATEIQSRLLQEYPEYLWNAERVDEFENTSHMNPSTMHFFDEALSSTFGRNRSWRALTFIPLLTSSLLIKIGIIYTQILQEENIFPLMPR